MASFKNLALRQQEEVEALVFGDSRFTVEGEDLSGLSILCPSKHHTRNLRCTLDKSGYTNRATKLSDGSYRVRVDYHAHH